MPQRIFLGYDRPFLPLLTEHLLEDRESLAGTLLITPTTQSGRILRESLAAEATALLAPTVSTPGAPFSTSTIPRSHPRGLRKSLGLKPLNPSLRQIG